MRFLAAFLVSLLSVAPALASVVLTVDEDGRENKVFLEADRARMTFEDGAAIYRADRKLLWALDDKDRSYAEITPETARRMNDAFGDVRKQMDEMLKSMPPEQRRTMEQQMGQMAKPPAPAAAKAVYRKTGRAATVGKWRCEEVERVVGGKKEEDLCVSRLGDLGLSRADLAVMYDMERFMASMVGTAFGQAAGGGEWEIEALAKALGYDAMPVRWRGADGKTSVVKSIGRATAPPASFEVPKGYRKQDMDLPKP